MYFSSYHICSDCSSAEDGPLKKGGCWTEAEAQLQGQTIVQTKIIQYGFPPQKNIEFQKKKKSVF